MGFLLFLFLSFQDSDLDRVSELIEKLDARAFAQRDDAESELKTLAKGNAQADALIEQALASGSAEIRTRAARVFRYRMAARLDADPVSLLKRLDSPNRSVQARALRRLQQKHGGAAAPLVVDFLTDRNFQYDALLIVGESKNPRYIKDVRPLVDDDRVGTRALDCLSRLGDASVRPKIREILESGLQGGRKARDYWILFESLTRYKDREDLAFLQKLIKGEDATTAQYLVRAVAAWPDAVEALFDDLKRLASEEMIDAMLVAGASGRKELAPVLKEACRSGKYLAPAALSLGMLGDRDAVPFLMNLVRYTNRPAVGIWGLGKMKAEEAVWLFRKYLKPSEDRTRRRAYSGFEQAYIAWALGEIGGSEAEETLISLLQSDTEQVRYEACLALGRLKSEKALSHLGAHLDDAIGFRRYVQPAQDASAFDAYYALSSTRYEEDWSQVRHAAVAALESITGKEMEGTADEQARAWKKWWKARSVDD